MIAYAPNDWAPKKTAIAHPSRVRDGRTAVPATPRIRSRPTTAPTPRPGGPGSAAPTDAGVAATFRPAAVRPSMASGTIATAASSAQTPRPARQEPPARAIGTAAPRATAQPTGGSLGG